VELEIEIDRGPALAMDRRTVDRDGRMSVTDCVLTSASVCPYVGREIPDWEKFGLSPDKVYRLYRDPVALEAAVDLFNAQPLLLDHVAVSAEQPQQQMIVGTIGDARWSENKVIGTVTVWDAEAIRGIESNVRRDISCGYYYVPDMTPGRTPSGEQFDGIMRGPLAINHIALCETGRVPGAMVSDSYAELRRRAGVRMLTVDTATGLRLARAGGGSSPFARAIPGYARLK
jgi:hypothetical protein